MDISTTYGAPGVTTSTTGMGTPQGGGDLDFLKELVRRRFGMQKPGTGRLGGDVSLRIAQSSASGGSGGGGSRSMVTGGDGSGGARINAPNARPDYGPTPASLGRFQMNHTGNWGTFVDPANIPAKLQETIMGGMYGGAGNWDTSNPSIMGPQQWKTGKYTHNGGVSMPGQIQPEQEESNSGFDYLSPVDKARAMAAAQRR